MSLLAGDIGGTKTLLGLQATLGTFTHVREYRNADFTGLDAILQDYVQHTGIATGNHLHLVLAVAGPVDQNRCQLTNLPWLIEPSALQARFRFTTVQLLNDLEATGWAMPGLAQRGKFISLRGDIDFRRPVVVISMGTGLGEAALLPSRNGGRRVLASEGGHKQFAPFNARSAALLQQAFAVGHNGISWENWFSGSGLPKLFQALFPEMMAPDSKTITTLAQTQPDSSEGQCVELLVQGLMSEAGNLALQYLAWGGVIFAGGVAQYLLPYLRNPDLQSWLQRKSDHQARLQSTPIALCTDTAAAMQGAADFYWHQQERGNPV
ncbi:MAG TPA: ROK family protein [Dongiaceae bacterium]|nr:ROK family protein [Dongiaceae bacterium]